MSDTSPPGPEGLSILLDNPERRRAGPGGSSVLHAAQKYRTEAREAYLAAQVERNADVRRALILKQERLVRLAVDLEKKAARNG